MDSQNQENLQIRIDRVYNPPSPGGGLRVLVDRMWPRGLKKEAAAVDLWLKEVAPSHSLRKWFGHDPERFEEFRSRYEAELESDAPAREGLRNLVRQARNGPLTLLFSARDEEHNNAAVLRDFILRTVAQTPTRAPEETS